MSIPSTPQPSSMPEKNCPDREDTTEITFIAPPGVDPSGIARVLRELEARLATHGFTLIWHVGLHNVSDKAHPSSNLTPAVIISWADETYPAIATFLQQFNAPILSLNNIILQQDVGKAQVTYLTQHGQQHIVFAAPERSDVQLLAQARLDGVRQECSTNGLAPPFVQVVPFSQQKAREAITHLLSQQSLPFGVCCYNDEIAFAVMAAFFDAGMRVPEDAAVIGCDNIPLAQFSIPALTTIGFENQQLLDVLTKNILAASHGEPIQELPSPHLSIVIRQSA